jgi:ankyrin repeat protein
MSREIKIGAITIHTDADTESMVLICTSAGQILKPRSDILRVFEGSVIAQALEEDAKAKELKLEQPCLTPAVITLVMNLAEGKEPETHEPKLKEASRYLNMPGLAIYSDPLHDYVDPINPNSSCNRRVFAEALTTGNTHMMEYLLKKGLCPNFYEPSKPYLRPRHARADVSPLGDWPIYYAVRAGFMEAVAMLIAHPKVGLKYVLQFAADKGDLKMLKLLTTSPRAKPEDITSVSFDKTEDCRLDVLYFLSEWGVTMNWRKMLDHALLYAEVDMAMWVLQSISCEQSDLLDICQRGYSEMCTVLLDNFRGNLSADNNACLGAAINRGHEDIIGILLRQRHIDLRVGLDEENGPLYAAINSERLDLVKRLMNSPIVRSNYKPKLALKWAQSKGTPEIVDFFKSLIVT